jgi:hypothetical protein
MMGVGGTRRTAASGDEAAKVQGGRKPLTWEAVDALRFLPPPSLPPTRRPSKSVIIFPYDTQPFPRPTGHL